MSNIRTDSFVNVPFTTMPLNKFNQHYLNQEQPSDEIVSSSTPVLNSDFYLCEPTTFYSKSVISLKGTKTNLNKNLYVLDNQETAFIIPYQCKITNVKHYASDGDVMINSVAYKYHELAGVELQSGDKLEFKLGTTDTMYADFTLASPLVKNV